LNVVILMKPSLCTFLQVLSCTELFTLHLDLPQPVSISFNEAIDFCLWVLEVDGLQVYPFHLHNPSGTRELQSCGLTVECWQRWFERVIFLQDPHLRQMNLDLDAELWADEQIAQYRRMAEAIQKFPEFSEQSIESIDFQEIRQTLVKRHHIHQQRRLLVEQRLYPYLNPIQIKAAIHDPSLAFKGNELLSTRLCEKWQQYQTVLDSRIAGRISTRVFLNDPDLEILPELNIFFVGYPACTEFLQQPNYVVAAKFQDRSNQAIRELIQWSVKSLMANQLR
jgi:hypothetical protein